MPALRRNVDLVTDLVGREFKLRYRRSVLGWLWAWAQPLARLAVLSFVFTTILAIETPNYVQNLFVGLVVWQLFAGGVGSATSCLVWRPELLARPGFDRLIVPVVSVLTDAFDFVVTLPILFGFLSLSMGWPPATALLLPIPVLCQLALVLGLGLMLSVANVYVRDVRLLVDLGLLLGFYVTPVFYTIATLPERYRWIAEVNPMARLLTRQRDLLVSGVVQDWTSIGVDVIISATVLGLGLVVFRRTTHSVVDAL